MKTLILFSTRDGQTREIASFLASELKEQGIDSDTVDLNRTNEVEWPLYDRVVIGASIRYGHFHPALERFVKTHLQSLQALPGAFSRLTSWRVSQKNERRKLIATRASFCSTRPAAPALRSVCRCAPLSTLSLVRSLYDPSYYEDDRRRDRCQ